MIEVRTLEEDAAELSRFSQQAWQSSYRGGMPIPVWDGPFFEWQFPRETAGDRDYVVGAYEGSKLVGVLGAQPFRFRYGGEEVGGTMMSWFAVSPAHQRQGIGSRLFAEQRRRHVARGERFALGYVYTGAAVSMGPKFFGNLPYMVPLGKVGFWARVLDHAAAARWDPSRVEGLAIRALGLLQGSPRSTGGPGARRYRAEDLPACLALLGELLEGVDLGFLWSRERFARQLEHDGMAGTVVAENGEGVAGFVNYHRLQYQGRTTMKAAIVDLLALGRLDPAQGRGLLRAALARMAEERLELALVLGLPCYPKAALWAAGFIPLPRDMTLICIRMDPDFLAKRPGRFLLYFR